MAGLRCEQIWQLRPSPWGVWDTSAACDNTLGGYGFCDERTLGEFDLKVQDVPEFQAAFDIPAPYADRFSMHLMKVICKGPNPNLVPVFRINMAVGCGNAFTKSPYIKVAVDCNTNEGFGCQDWLFDTSGKLANRVVLYAWVPTNAPNAAPVTIQLRMLLDHIGCCELNTQNNPLPNGFVTKV